MNKLEKIWVFFTGFFFALLIVEIFYDIDFSEPPEKKEVDKINTEWRYDFYNSEKGGN